jgi:hypothetical protein
MPDVTPAGLPIPLDTDPVTDGAAAIRALAAAIDARGAPVIAAGQANVVVLAGTPPAGTAAIVFPVGRFAVPPVVLAVPQTNVALSAAEFCEAFVSGVTTAGCNITVRRHGTATVAVSWVAVSAP